jgi:hypothetical protein
MKTLMHSKILAIAAAVMLGLKRLVMPPLRVTVVVLAAASAVLTLEASLAPMSAALAAHIGGLGVHPMPGIAMGHGLNDHGLGHTHVPHELRDHHFRVLYGVSPLYVGTDCSWPQDLTIESCSVESDID